MLSNGVNLDIDYVARQCVGRVPRLEATAEGDSKDLEVDYKDERPRADGRRKGMREEGVEIDMDYEAQKRLFLASHDRSPFFF